MTEIKIAPDRDQTVALCIDTIRRKKQALVFCSSKRAAESQAEKNAKKIQPKCGKFIDFTESKTLSEKILHVLANPTKQCKRLAACVEKGVAFHHAGLASKQRELIEDAFRDGIIRVICSTPTLAAGLDMPAFRAIIRDHKRFGQRGMAPIQVLEYEQMSGRAGRPGKEDYGEAILVASKEADIDHLNERYLHGEVEPIYSKLAVEPVLRTYILSLVATKLIKTTKQLYEFFDKTFYAEQFGNRKKIHTTLDRMIILLREWDFLETFDKKGKQELKKKEKKSLFINANNLLKEKHNITSELLLATALGKRVSEIYLDPLTAHLLLTGLEELIKTPKEPSDYNQTFALVHLICCSLEMRPLLSVKVGDVEHVESLKQQQEVFFLEDDFYSYSQNDYDETIKTTEFLMHWMNEWTEDSLLDKYGIRPGEITGKINHADWLLYACDELLRINKEMKVLKIIRHIRTRLKQGVKSELIPLLRFKGVGRVRARKLYAAGIKTIALVKQVPINRLVEIIGATMAKRLKEQSGDETVYTQSKKIIQEEQGDEEVFFEEMGSRQTNLRAFK